MGGCQPRGLGFNYASDPILVRTHASTIVSWSLRRWVRSSEREEGLLVGRDLREVMTALLDHRCDADEAVADLVLTLRQRRAAFHRSTEIDAVALVRGRCSGSVGREQHLLAAVLTALSGFGQCAGYMINSG